MTHAEDRLKQYLYGNLKEDTFKRRVLGENFDRPKILLVHGILSSSSVFFDSGFVAKLETMGYEVFTIGNTPSVSGAVFQSDEYLNQVLNQIGGFDAVNDFDYIIGHSEGGRITADLTFDNSSVHGITLNSAKKSAHTTDISTRDDFLLLSPFASNKDIDKWGSGSGHSFSSLDQDAILEIADLGFYNAEDWWYDLNKSFGD